MGTSAADPFTVGLRRDYGAASGPASVALADVNGDARTDLVLANYTAGSFSVRLGTGTGNFGALASFVTAAGAQSVATGDFNGDGRLDVAVANYTASTVSVLFGNGSGGFGAKIDLTAAANPQCVAIADVNLDGRPDLAVANEGPGTASVFLGDGAGGFAARSDFAAATGPTSVALGDVNGDGNPDLAVANFGSNSVSVLLGDGAGGFSPKTDFTTASGPVSVQLADVNGDGKLDLAVASFSANVISILIGNGAGGFGTKTDFATGTQPRMVDVRDVNLDGIADLAVSNQGAATVSVLLGNGNGTFAAKTDFPTAAGPVAVAIGDMNGDGRPDVVTADKTASLVTVSYGNDTGPFLPAEFCYPRPFGDGEALAYADLNGDGKLDAAVADLTRNVVSVSLAYPYTGFPTWTDYAVGTSPRGVLIGDINLDGHPDLVVSNAGSNSISVLLGNAAGAFGPKTDFAAGPAPRVSALGDLNADGRFDVAVPDNGSDSVSVFYNTTVAGASTPTFQTRVAFATGHLPRAAAIADLNFDFVPDLVVANANTPGSVSVLLSTGSGLSPKSDYATGNATVSVALTDLNKDFNPDIVVANTTSSTVSVFLNSGSGTFGTKTDYATGTGPNAVVAGDMNGDGLPDVATVNSASISVLLGDGAGTLGARAAFSVGGSPTLAIGRLDDQGTPDLSLFYGAWVCNLEALERTRTVLSVSPDPVVLGTPLSLTATVTVVSPGDASLVAAANVDSVSFFDGTTLLGKAPCDGTAGITLAAPFLGSRSITAVYNPSNELYPSISSAKVVRVVATAKPTITSIKDIGSDQGLQVRVKFAASPFDFAGSGTQITGYYLYRKTQPGSLAQKLAEASVRAAALAAPDHALLAGWDYLLTVPATTESAYEAVAPTLADSNGTGIHRATFMVRATTSSPSTFFDSAPDSGFSLDNLPPAAPAPFTGVFLSGATHLHWGANSEPDLWYYKVYRGSSAGFVPGAGNLIATRSDTGYADPGPAGSYYKLSAVDVNGNESGTTLLTPSGTVDTPGSTGFAFALEGVRPNPSRGRRLAVMFVLPNSRPANLELLDVSGRRVTAREVGSLGEGRHVVDLHEGRSVAPGLYLLRLTQGTNVRVLRVIVLD